MTALSLENVSISFGGVQAVSDLSIDVAAGERRVLLGPNGAGKTTLFNMIGGQLLPREGQISFFDQDVTMWPPYRRARAGLARTFQITSLFYNQSVEENIYLAVQGILPHRYNLLRNAETFAEAKDHVEAVLAQWQLDSDRRALVGDLSYGTQRKLEIAMALVHRPRVLLLDEPTAGLSTSETASLVALIKTLGRDVTIIMIEHDMRVAFEIGETFTVMNRGRVIAEGDAAAIHSEPEIQAIYLGEVSE